MATYEVDNEIIILEYPTNGNSNIAKVKFVRWDSSELTFVEICVVASPPFQCTLDTSTLPFGWNEIIAQLYDAQDRYLSQTYIWVYRNPNPLFLPIVSR